MTIDEQREHPGTMGEMAREVLQKTSYSTDIFGGSPNETSG
jgi:hypothetical protein